MVAMRTGPARILVVDDEPYITDLLGAALRFEGFEVDVAASGTEALGRAADGHDLVLLDVMLPDVDGVEVCRRLRRDGIDTPVLFLTARDGTEDKVDGLAVGADDYVTKPFSLDELVARIRAVLRRAGSPVAAVADARMIFADLELDEQTHEVRRHGQSVDLTATEFSLLHFLLANARRVVSKSDILDAVWGFGFDGDPNIVETYISYLRKKLDCFEPPLIHTVRGVGYCLRLPRDAS